MNSILKEAFVIKRMAHEQRNKHVVELLDQGRVNIANRNPFQFTVVSLLGPNIFDLLNLYTNKRMSPATTALLAIQMLEAVEDLHKCGFMHRDITSDYDIVSIKAPPYFQSIQAKEFHAGGGRQAAHRVSD